MSLRYVLMFAIAAGSYSASWSQDLAGKITALAKPYVDSETVVGLSIGVVKGDQTTAVHLGKTKSGGQSPSDDTVYEIGSISKVFTGILLGDAVSRGDARLDQPVQQLLPAGVTMPAGKRAITLVDISTHTSGLPRLSNNMPSLTSKDPYADYTSKLAHEFLNSHKLRREPGAKQEYSNFAVSLLGHLLSQKSGKSYDKLMADRITEPLGMTDTSVQLTGTMASRLATPHIAVNTIGTNWGFADMPGAGGIRSTTADMLKFAQACLDPPESSTGKAIELAWKEHYAGGVGAAKMGLGWHFAGDGSTRWHNGQTGGYHSMLMVNRQLNSAVVLLTNTATGEVDQLASQVIQMLAGAKPEPRHFEAGMKVSPEKMKRLEGQYQLAPTFVFTVTAKEGKLMVGVTNQPTMQVFAKSETEWFYKAVEASLTFQLDKNGQCQALVLFQNGVRQTAKKIR
ncbi:serine hydrolase [Planctomycetes bacterium K23_9]|uniref:Beta-lactamase n=1 Tax=Stieleria marina TaxID=1930275 RepID=A0A517P2E3_9BACT|nr:D-alanyl-D-alanine-carboxypeptidase/endopeptidase AmpH precursor [Planctomycetes bacterium K23_9]